MDKKEYEAKRAQLLADMKAAIDAGDAVKAEAVYKEILALDEKFQALATAAANLAALNGTQAAAAPVIPAVLHTAQIAPVSNEKAEEEKLLQVKKTKLEEEFKSLNKQLSVVGTDEYIISSAVRDFSYVKRDAIRFEYTNPEVLYAYSEAELQILMDELND